jgi:ATP-dependent DNA helicase RecG
MVEIHSPGGFPPGINPGNIIYKQVRRNLSIANVFRLCGLIEASGQGADLMFRESILQGKSIPDYSRSDDHEVVLKLDGQVKDNRIMTYLQRIGRETLRSFTIEDYLIVYALWSDERPEKYLDATTLPSRLQRLIGLGIIERTGRGRGVRHILSRRIREHLGERGTYTRSKGLDKETNKALLLTHLTDFKTSGSRMKELLQVLPNLNRFQILSLLYELESENKAYHIGNRRAAKWFLNE